MTVTLAQMVRRAADRLRERDTPFNTPELDAEVLARHVLGWDRARWLTGNRSEPPPDFEAQFHSLIERRLGGEPVAYITGTREFHGLDFEVTPAVLIPRPETELLVELALREIDRVGARHAVDVGTGSGCVAIALAHERPLLHVTATDISAEALAVARRNAARHAAGNRVTFVHAPLLGGVPSADVVVSNPPYVSETDARVMREVRDFEPHTALFAPGDGLDVIRLLLAEAAARPKVSTLLFEFGGNEAKVRRAVDESGLRLREIARDLAGIPRVAIVEG